MEYAEMRVPFKSEQSFDDRREEFGDRCESGGMYCGGIP